MRGDEVVLPPGRSRPHCPRADSLRAGILSGNSRRRYWVRYLVDALATAFAEDLAPQGVRVVAVNPGPVQTPVLDRYLAVRAEREGISREEALERHAREQPLGLIPTPEEVAELVTFLASDAAHLISGTSVDFGGRGRAL